MKRKRAINLLREIDSIRNTVRREELGDSVSDKVIKKKMAVSKPFVKEAGSSFVGKVEPVDDSRYRLSFFNVYSVAFALLLIIFGLYYGFYYRASSVAEVSSLSDQRLLELDDKQDLSGLNVKKVDLSEALNEDESVKGSDIAVDDKAGNVKELKPGSEPLAEDIKKEEVFVEQPLKGKDIWLVRYGVCVYKESCSKLVDQLASKGIESNLVYRPSDNGFYGLVRIGSFESIYKANRLILEFKRVGLKSKLQKERKLYFVEINLDGEKKYMKVKSISEQLGYRSELRNGIKQMNLYKVYDKRESKDKDNAVSLCNEQLGKNQDCTVEKKV